MKYKAKMYARALIDVLADKKTPAQAQKIADNVIALLKKNGDGAKIREIIFLAEYGLYKKTGKRKIVLESARKITKKNLLKSFLRKGDVVLEKINADLVAGIKMVINDEKQLDFSLRKKLDEIFK